MVGMEYCPITGTKCSQGEVEIRVQPDTFFLAEPFKPDEDRKRREDIIKIVLSETMKDKYCGKNLRVADKEPREAIFCDICRLIQSSAYGIADISGLNPNVLLELGMMFALGKPVSIIFRKSEEKSLRENLPSDIAWKRVIPYGEFLDLHEELGNRIRDRPVMPSVISPATEIKKIIAERDPELAKQMDSRLQEILKVTSAEFERLMEKTKLSGAMSGQKVEIEPSVYARIDMIFEKVKQVEKLVGFPKDAESAFLKGNWYFKKEEYERANELYDWVLNLKPDSHEALGNKGISLDKLGKYDEAIKCYDEAIKIKPDSHEAWNDKSEILVIAGRTQEGLESARRALTFSKNPKQKALSLLLISLALRLQGNVEEAESEMSILMNHIRDVGSLAVCSDCDFSHIKETVMGKLSNDEKTRMLSLIAFLKGEKKSL